MKKFHKNPFFIQNIPILFSLILIFGGAAQFFILNDIISRISALTILALLLSSNGYKKYTKFTFIIIIIFLVPILQLIPLPQFLWEFFPSSDYIKSINQATGTIVHWQQISISPTRTLDSILFLIIPLAAFLLGYDADRNLQFKIVQAVLFVSIVGVLIGYIQITYGDESNFYFYEVTNFGSIVGFFANRNHHGVFLAISTLLIIPLIKVKYGHSKLYFFIGVLINILLMITIILTESRMATLIGFACLIITLFQTKDLIKTSNIEYNKNNAAVILTFISSFLIIIYLMLMIFGPTADRFIRLANEEFNRSDVYPIIFSAWKDFWLFGSGLGSFEWVAPQYEMQDNITYAYWNHAHNDFAQILIELGIFGLFIILLFSYIYAKFVIRFFKSSCGVNSIEFSGLVILGALALHSIVDYPLRTPALSALFFFVAGLLAANLPPNAPQDKKHRCNPDPIPVNVSI
jgi:O-antigen ligase